VNRHGPDYLPRQMRNWHVGALVFVETHRRILKGEFGKIPAPLKDDAFSMGSYCIDAPDDIPAGGMASEQLADDMWSEVQLTVWREV